MLLLIYALANRSPSCSLYSVYRIGDLKKVPCTPPLQAQFTKTESKSYRLSASPRCVLSFNPLLCVRAVRVSSAKVSLSEVFLTSCKTKYNDQVTKERTESTDWVIKIHTVEAI